HLNALGEALALHGDVQVGLQAGGDGQLRQKKLSVLALLQDQQTGLALVIGIHRVVGNGQGVQRLVQDEIQLHAHADAEPGVLAGDRHVGGKGDVPTGVGLAGGVFGGGGGDGGDLAVIDLVPGGVGLNGNGHPGGDAGHVVVLHGGGHHQIVHVLDDEQQPPAGGAHLGVDGGDGAGGGGGDLRALQVRPELPQAHLAGAGAGV